jgi:protein TonB
MEIASLSAEIRQRQAAYSGRERHKHISANTREYKYASYMDAWRAKVERIGKLNYPEEARRRKLSGSLLLDVAINVDGSVQSISLRRSSGIKVLDDAAMRIVRLAAPFAPLPENIRKDTDVLHIIRTWIFKSGDSLYTK